MDQLTIDWGTLIEIVIPLATFIIGIIGKSFFVNLYRRKRQSDVIKDEFKTIKDISDDYLQTIYNMGKEVELLHKQVLDLRIVQLKMASELDEKELLIKSLREEKTNDDSGISSNN